MILLLLPVMVFSYALFLALQGGPHRSAEERRQPSMAVRLGTLALNVLALGWHLYASVKLRPMVPEGAAAGTVAYGGPGDGFVFLFMIALPWLSMQVINLPLAWAGSATYRQFFAFWGLLLVCWLTAGYVGSQLMQCPPGIVCVSG
jgi:hypothetical protein